MGPALNDTIILHGMSPGLLMVGHFCLKPVRQFCLSGRDALLHAVQAASQIHVTSSQSLVLHMLLEKRNPTQVSYIHIFQIFGRQSVLGPTVLRHETEMRRQKEISDASLKLKAAIFEQFKNNKCPGFTSDIRHASNHSCNVV
jgi:hypothetical protein